MKQIERIVCPVDFSDPSDAALTVAVELAEHFSAEIVLVHVINEIDPTPTPSYTLTPQMMQQIPEMMNHMQENAHRAMQVLIDAHVAGRVPARDEVAIGSPADGIVRVAEQIDADMIVIATHGRSGFKGLLFGSVAEKVVRTADCPVLTMKFKPADAQD